VAEDAEIDDVEEAFRFIQMPMMQAELQAIIELGMSMAQDVTGMPLIMQGQQEDAKAPNTLGGMQILQNNAGAPLRGIARNFDDYITESHVRRYYQFLLQDPNVPDEEKGDFQIDARGSSALVDRDLNNQAIASMLQMVSNPVFGLDPKRWSSEYLRSQKLDPQRFEFQDDEWQKVVEGLAAAAQAGAGGGGDKGQSAMQVAQLRAEVDNAKLQQKDATEKADRELEIAKLGLAREQTQKDQQMAIALESIQREIEGAKLQSGESNMLAKIKADLAKVVMQLNTQRELSGANFAHDANQTAAQQQQERVLTAAELAHDANVTHATHQHEDRQQAAEHKHAVQVAEAAVEPAGRAKPGRAFEE